ncbi:hypothetical protein AB0D89_32910 [Streptomyces luteogriseus]|uniref:hypothetical protein n=1 Tax=Streptomyces luteogriseus TaxID=68233 RepID=UPI0033FDAAEB
MGFRTARASLLLVTRGLLRGSHRVLTNSQFIQAAAEVAAACVRSATDALLGLLDARATVGLKPAAEGLLGRGRHRRVPMAEAVARHGPVVRTLG